MKVYRNPLLKIVAILVVTGILRGGWIRNIYIYIKYIIYIYIGHIWQKPCLVWHDSTFKFSWFSRSASIWSNRPRKTSMTTTKTASWRCTCQCIFYMLVSWGGVSNLQANLKKHQADQRILPINSSCLSTICIHFEPLFFLEPIVV